MSKSITLTYCGMQGTGPTVKAAKLDATRMIEDALNGLYTPSFVRVGNQVALLVRHPNYGWEYAILTEDNGSLRQELPFPQGGYDTVVEAKEKAIAHLCGNLVTGETMFTVGLIVVQVSPPSVVRCRYWLPHIHAVVIVGGAGDGKGPSSCAA